MLRTRDFKLVINPESINELYDLRLDPAEMNNVYTVPVYDEIRRELATNLYLQLRERGDHSFAKWMAAMTDFDIPLVNTAPSPPHEGPSDQTPPAAPGAVDPAIRIPELKNVLKQYGVDGYFPTSPA